MYFSKRNKKVRLVFVTVTFNTRSTGRKKRFGGFINIIKLLLVKPRMSETPYLPGACTSLVSCELEQIMMPEENTFTFRLKMRPALSAKHLYGFGMN